MAVAVKNTLETASRRPLNRLAVDSWLGVLYVLASVGIVFYGLPALWAAAGPGMGAIGLSTAVQTSLLILAMVLAAGGLIYGGRQFVGHNPPHGLEAGVFFGVVEVIAIGLFTCALGSLLERWMGSDAVAGAGLTAAIGLVLLLGAIALFFLAAFERRVIQVEDQGWFTLAAYKRSQGQRVRRGTIVGILALAACGIYTLNQHHALGAGALDWTVTIPFTGGRTLTLLPAVRYTVPFLLMVGSLWMAYRVVNLPVFADFLIATEAELNKVSWTTRKRLIQDTVVVLVTVLLLTVFLFVVDQIWALVLTKVGVLQIAPPSGGPGGPKPLPY